MAQSSHGRATRPLSPHLQIWRWGPAMAVSILHRASGHASIAGLLILLCWLAALVSGDVAYAKFLVAFGSPLGKLVLFVVSWAFFNHFCSGIRHFILDIGAGFELKRNNFWSALTPVIGFVLNAAFWAALLLR